MTKYRVVVRKEVTQFEERIVEVQAETATDALIAVAPTLAEGELSVGVARIPNLERLHVLKEYLRVLPDEQFDMRTFFSRNGESVEAPAEEHTCGTAACVGGWAVILFGRGDTGDAASVAADRLELDATQADRLFMPEPEGGAGISTYWRQLTRHDAIAAINGLMKTGRVQWRGQKPED